MSIVRFDRRTLIGLSHISSFFSIYHHYDPILRVRIFAAYEQYMSLSTRNRFHFILRLVFDLLGLVFLGSAVASWFERPSPDRTVRAGALAGDIVLCSWARHLTLIVPLSTQEYKWVPANCWGNLTNCGGVTCGGLAPRPGEVEILLAASCYRNRDKKKAATSLSTQRFQRDNCT